MKGLFRFGLLTILCLGGLLPPANVASAQSTPQSTALSQKKKAEKNNAAKQEAAAAERAEYFEEAEQSGEPVSRPDAEVSDSEATEEPVEKAPVEPLPRVIPEPPEGGWDVYVVPIEGPITSPQLYILRRALKEAIENDIEAVVLQMDTPGGALGVTLDMMEALSRFDGETITFVDAEAVSAGSYIAVATDDIWFAPEGIMGAAEAVTGSGEDIDESMQRKINSYLRAKVRVLGREYRYRADVQRAMMDPSYVLEIDGVVIKPEGELLSLTADEAATYYGDPPEPLLASGIAKDIDDLLTQKYGEGNYNMRTFEVTWSEEFAKWFKTIAPVIMGIGVLLIIIEVKTPHFGLIGGAGIALVLLVFVSNYFAGMAGHIEVIVFIVGVLLVVAEVFLFPGTLVAGALGAILMAGSLLWAMADIWPTPEGGYTVNWPSVEIAIRNLLIAVVIAILGSVLLWRYLKGSGLYRHVVSQGAIGKLDYTSGATLSRPEVGAQGVAINTLRPTGTVEIDGHRYEATVVNGQINAGRSIVVTGYSSFGLKVEEA